MNRAFYKIDYLRVLLFILLGSALSLLFPSCRQGSPCEGALTVDSSSLAISFIDKQTGKYLYTENNSLYNIDSLKAFDQAGNQLHLLYGFGTIPNSNQHYYTVVIPIYNSQMDQNSFSMQHCKNLIVKYTYNNTDTIRACFKSKANNCGSIFETLKIYYKNILISDLSNNNYAIFYLYKE